MSSNVYTGVCLAAAIGVAAPAVAQTRNSASKTSGGKTVTAIGCLEAGTEANSFVLNVLEGGRAVPVGSRVSLTTADRSEAQAHIGQKVQILGTILGARRSSAGSGRPSRMFVRDIRQVAPRCAAGAPAPATTAGLPGTAANTSGTTAAPSTVRTSAPGTAAPSGAMSNSSTPTGATSAESKTALSGTLAQTGVSGNATLAGSPGSTTPTSASPVNTAAAPLSAPMMAASSRSSTAAKRASTPATTQMTTAPTAAAPTLAAPATLTPTDPPPVAVTGDPAVAQQMTNTSTMIGTLDQTGVSGDALLTGLVSVNVQQVMAAVQAQANVPVQADVIVNISDIANDLQVQALVQALNTNPQASMNANDLTSALQSAGLIDPNQFVVGVTGSEIYSNTDLTTKLQQRGIISPSETIMSMLPARIYVAQP
jgi:hypothetical protein